MLLCLIASYSARLLEIRANNQGLLDGIDNLEEKYISKIVDGILADGTYKISAGALNLETNKKEVAQNVLNIVRGLDDIYSDMSDVISHLKTIKAEPKDELKSGNQNFAIIFTKDADLIHDLKGIEDEGAVKFYISSDEKDAEKYGVPFPGILAFNARDKNFITLPPTKNLTSLTSAIVLPSLVRINNETFRHLQHLEQKLYYVIENSKNFNDFKAKFEQLCRTQSSVVKFVFFGPEDVPTLIDLLKTNESEYPLLVSLNKGSKGIVRNVTPDNFLASVHSLNTNSAERLVFNVVLPEDNDSRPVRVLNTDTFDSFIERTDADVMVAFTSLKCGFCTALEPVLNEFSILLAKNNIPLHIGNYYVNENEDQPKFETPGVPTLYFKKVGSSKFSKVPGDVRSLPEFLKFVAREGGSSKINLDDYSEFINKKSVISPDETSDSGNDSEVETDLPEKNENKQPERNVL